MNFFCRVLATVSLALAATAAFAQAPDTILLNGKIVTADVRNTIHQALAVRDGRIVALGKQTLVGISVKNAGGVPMPRETLRFSSRADTIKAKLHELSSPRRQYNASYDLATNYRSG